MQKSCLVTIEYVGSTSIDTKPGFFGTFNAVTACVVVGGGGGLRRDLARAFLPSMIEDSCHQ